MTMLKSRELQVTALLVPVLLMVSLTDGKIIDLSHKLTPTSFMSLHGDPGYNLTTLFVGDFLPGMYVEMNFYGSSEHGGTHIDAPSHFIKGGRTLDEIPIEDTIREGVMINCADEAIADPSYAVTLKKILDWEAENGEIPRGAAVLFYFDWSHKYLDEKRFRGTTNVSDPMTYTFPYVSVEAGRWLWEKRQLKMLGTDTTSADPYQTGGIWSGFPLHVYLLPRNVILLENLKDLHRLPPRNFRLHAAPVKYLKATGAQTRIYAMTYEVDSENNGSDLFYLSPLMLMLTFVCRVISWL